VNKLIERYETEGHRMEGSRKMRNLVVESFVLKRKRKCERDKEEGTPVRGYR
jgi:hypothetical protein